MSWDVSCVGLAALARRERIDTESGRFHSAECDTIEGWNYFHSRTGFTLVITFGHWKPQKERKRKEKRVIRRAQTFLWDPIKTDLHANLSPRRSYTRNSQR